MNTHALARTVLSWNRREFDLASDEILAQVLDRGSLDAWKELYALAARDAGLRSRILAIVYRVPLPFPAFWLALMASVGEAIDWNRPLPTDTHAL